MLKSCVFLFLSEILIGNVDGLIVDNQMMLLEYPYWTLLKRHMTYIPSFWHEVLFHQLYMLVQLFVQIWLNPVHRSVYEVFLASMDLSLNENPWKTLGVQSFCEYVGPQRVPNRQESIGGILQEKHPRYIQIELKNTPETWYRHLNRWILEWKGWVLIIHMFISLSGV